MHTEHGRCKINGALTGGWAKGGYVVACDLLAPILEAHKGEFEDEDRSPHEGQPSGWRQALADRAAAITGRTPEAIFRRLYDIMHGKTRAVSIDMAEGMLLACGLLLDHDTDLPTLPASMVTARDMVDVHAEMYDPSLTLDEKESLARSLLNFSHGFVLFDIGERAAEAVGAFLVNAAKAPTREEIIAAEAETAGELVAA